MNNRVLIGEGYDGKVYHNFQKYPHMVIAGATGYGKTNFIKSLIRELDGEIVLLDLKESDDYPVVTASNIHSCVKALGKVEKELRKKRSRELFVVVDEAAELQPPAFIKGKDQYPYLYCQAVISEICRMGRSLGVHSIFATQYPTADVLGRHIKQNSEARICFRLPTEVASRVALDSGGAESLPGGLCGRALYKTDTVRELQTYEFGGVDCGNEWTDKIRNTGSEGDRDTITVG